MTHQGHQLSGRFKFHDVIFFFLILAAPVFWFKPFAFGYYVRVPRELLLASAGAVFLGLFVLKKNSWLGLLVIAASANALFQSLVNRIFFHQGFYILLLISGGCAVYLWASEAKKISRIVCVQIICATASANAIYSGMQFFGYDFLQVYGPVKATVGFMDNPGLLGQLMAISWPLSLVFAKWAIIPILAGLFFSKSILSVFAAFISTVILVNHEWRKKIFKVSVFAIPVFAMLTVGTPDIDRWGRYDGLIQRAKVASATLYLWPKHINWQTEPTTLRMDKTSMFMGWGLGSFYTRFIQWDLKLFAIGLLKRNVNEVHNKGVVSGDSRIIGEAWRQAHNEYIQILFEMGLVGIFFVFGYMFNVFNKVGKVIKEKKVYLSVVISSFILAALHFPFHIVGTAVPLLAIMGFLDGEES